MMEEGEWRRGKRRSGYGSTPEEHNKRRSKRGSTRSSDDRAIDANGQWNKRIREVDYGGARWREDRINPIAPPSAPFKYLAKTLAAAGRVDHSGRRLGKLASTVSPCGPS
jgi:hypothetical protein